MNTTIIFNIIGATISVISAAISLYSLVLNRRIVNANLRSSEISIELLPIQTMFFNYHQIHVNLKNMDSRTAIIKSITITSPRPSHVEKYAKGTSETKMWHYTTPTKKTNFIDLSNLRADHGDHHIVAIDLIDDTKSKDNYTASLCINYAFGDAPDKILKKNLEITDTSEEKRGFY